MSTTMTMPKLGVNMTKATVAAWVAKEGDVVTEGDHLFDAETDKAIQEIPATVSGILSKILVRPGDTIGCQEPVAVFSERAEGPVADGTSSGTLPGPSPDAPSGFPPNGSSSKGNGRMRISPLAKKLARELALDYTQIPARKPGARVVKADVLAFAERRSQSGREPVRPSPTLRPAAAPAPVAPGPSPDPRMDAVETIALSGTRAVIAERMSASVRTTARAVLSLHAEAQDLIAWRERLKSGGARISYNDLLTRIVGKALREFPIMNARIEQNEIRCLKQVNIGIAVATDKGLVVPVVRDADQKGVLAINADFLAMIERARAGKSTPDDLADGTFTLTNLGMFGIEVFIPIIKPPECAILGVGAILREPVVIDDADTVAVRPRMQLTLAFDHRIVDGAPAARFLQRVKQLIEWPMGLMS